MKPTLTSLLLFVFIVLQTHYIQAQKPNQVLHVVKPKETLYSLLKKYQNTEAEFIKLNPNYNKELGLKINQELVFTKTKTTPLIKQEPKSINTGIHVVGQAETIFSLAKLYSIDIAEFVSANNLTDNIIKPGQKLIVDQAILSQLNKKYITEKLVLAPQGKKITEEGIAEVVETKNRTRKFLALHKTAPKGSVIKVTNEANGEFITAKVVGNLNKVGPDEKIMLKLSPLAYYQLRPKDSKMRAKVEFYKPM